MTHLWPSGARTDVHRAWIGEQWRLGQVTLAIAHSTAQGVCYRLVVWAVSSVTGQLQCLLERGSTADSSRRSNSPSPRC